jgi:Ca-activated chloride channel family protein
MVLAVDVSGSMRALDLGRGGAEQTRLDAVKQVFERFVLGDGEALRGRRDDAIGLVSFAGFADTRSPVTLDHGNLVVAARQLELVTERSEDGTAIGDGLALAVERLRQHPARSKVAIVLTDGVETAGTLPARSAIDLAVEHGIKVYAIGAGTNGVAPVRVETEMGSRLVQMPVEIDEALLREIAQRTGGEYFRATDGAGLERVYAAIDKLERSELVELQFTSFHEYYPYFVGAALILIALAFGLRGTVLRRLP